MLMNPERDYSQYRETKTVGLGYQVIIVLMLLLSLVMLVCSATFLAFPEQESTTENNLPDDWIEPPAGYEGKQEPSYEVVDLRGNTQENENTGALWVEPPAGYEGKQEPSYDVVDLRNNEQSSSHYITAEEMEGLVPPPGGW